MPFVSAGSILAYENFKQVASSLRPLLLLLTNSRSSDYLVETRENLKKVVRRVVDDLGWLNKSDRESLPMLAQAQATSPDSCGRYALDHATFDLRPRIGNRGLVDDEVRPMMPRSPSKSRNLTELNVGY